MAGKPSKTKTARAAADMAAKSAVAKAAWRAKATASSFIKSAEEGIKLKYRDASRHHRRRRALNHAMAKALSHRRLENGWRRRSALVIGRALINIVAAKISRRRRGSGANIAALSGDI